jgi:signal transduction histidine kinase
MRRDDVARVEVDDRGPGVPQGERSAIFERFYRGAVSGRRGTDSGAGLGLALVAEHVHAHGGRVWVEDRDDGEGARFVFEIPWRPA